MHLVRENFRRHGRVRRSSSRGCSLRLLLAERNSGADCLFECWAADSTDPNTPEKILTHWSWQGLSGFNRYAA